MYVRNYISSRLRRVRDALGLSHWRLLTIILALPIGYFFSSFVLVHALVPAQSEKTVPHATVASKPAANTPRPQQPKRIEIPLLGINADVKPFGVNAQGNMDIDENMANVAWYKNGPKPGERGSAVIAGHYGWKEGLASVFNEIHTLKKGDKISVHDENGTVITFVTQRIEQYDPAADTTEIFFSSDGKSHLNLITCDGTWVNALNTYTKRLVVFADREI